jgi:hypothetical protein
LVHHWKDNWTKIKKYALLVLVYVKKKIFDDKIKFRKIAIFAIDLLTSGTFKINFKIDIERGTLAVYDVRF